MVGERVRGCLVVVGVVVGVGVAATTSSMVGCWRLRRAAADVRGATVRVEDMMLAIKMKKERREEREEKRKWRCEGER